MDFSHILLKICASVYAATIFIEFCQVFKKVSIQKELGNLKMYVLDTEPLRKMQMCFECLIYLDLKIHIFKQSCHDNLS